MKRQEKRVQSLNKRMQALIMRQAEMRQSIIDAIFDYVMAAGGTIEFDSSIQSFGIIYDGGNHPEYNANPYSTIYSITAYSGINKSKSKGGTYKSFYATIEDCDRYDVERMNINDLSTVLEAVASYSKDYIVERDVVDEDEIGQLD